MTVKELEIRALNVKKRILKTAFECGKNVHIGGSLSMVELLTVLYLDILNYKVDNLRWADRDRFILSKGHCALALYTVLTECGILTEEQLATFMMEDTELVVHPVMNVDLGIESSNGSLGQGLSMAVGIAKAAKIRNKDYQVYVLIGNGECNEGSIWEAAMLAAAWKLDNLTVILDNNHLQNDGISKNVLDMKSMDQKWESFGFLTKAVDGHNIEEIRSAFHIHKNGMPKIIIGNTKKGYGISFMENHPEWHHNRLTRQLYEDAMKELEGTE